MNENSASPAATSRYWRPSSIYVSGAFDTCPMCECHRILPIGRIVGHDVASQIAAEQELARGGQQSA